MLEYSLGRPLSSHIPELPEDRFGSIADKIDRGQHQRMDQQLPELWSAISRIRSKLDPYVEKLSTWLVMEAKRSWKQRRNLRQIYTSSW